MRKKAFFLFLFLVTLMPLIIVFSPEDPLLLSSYSEENSPFSVPVNFTETSEYVKLDNGLVVEFYKEAYGYNRIYLRNGTVLVYNERVYLEYWAGSQWKPRGVPTHITWVQVSDTFYEVTRHFTDYLGTTYNVTYSVMSGQPIKMAVSLKSGPANEYKIAWELNGITQTAYSEFENYTVFGDNQTDAWLGVDWEDVVYDWGNITSTSIESDAQGRKMTLSFEIGMVGISQTVFLDPSLISSFSESNEDGYESIETTHPSGNGYHSAIGQTFTTSLGYELTSVKFYLKKYGTWGIVKGHAFLYAHTGTFGSGGKPIGVTLAESDEVTLSAVLTTNYQLIEFTFSGEDQYLLSAGVPYSICVIVDEGTLGATKSLRVGRDGSSPTHDGNGFSYDGNWDAETYDTIFYLYGEPSGNKIVNGVLNPTVNGVSGSFKVNGVG